MSKISRPMLGDTGFKMPFVDNKHCDERVVGAGVRVGRGRKNGDESVFLNFYRYLPYEKLTTWNL